MNPVLCGKVQEVIQEIAAQFSTVLYLVLSIGLQKECLKKLLNAEPGVTTLEN